MLKIGEFSKLSRISVRMLCHYDEIGFLKPGAGKAENCDSAPDPKGIMAGQIRAGNDRTISALSDTMILTRDGGSADGVA